MGRPTYDLPASVILEDDKRAFVGPFDVLATMRPGRLAEARGKSYPVKLEHLPPMIRFRVLDDPTSVEVVDPANLAARYGPGVALRSVRLEITNDPVTKTITQRLPWLYKLSPDKNLSGDTSGLYNAGEVPYAVPRHTNYWNLSAE